jgi:diguanylate cyclase (GGDEF)-like protein
MSSSAALSPLLWMLAFQFGLYALGWVVCNAMLREDNDAVAHWGLFLLLMAAALLLAGGRGEPRTWLAYNGAALMTLLAFASMRRGFERFLRAPGSDTEQWIVLGLAGGAVALAGLGTTGSSWRTLITYLVQGYLLARTVMMARLPLRAEFGRAAYYGVVIPGLLIAVALAALGVRQAAAFGTPQEVHVAANITVGVMGLYLFTAALFNTGFMLLLTQRLLLKLRRASRQDALTGLENRSSIDTTLHHLWAQRGRGGEGFAVLMIDVDFFKSINDAHGHAVGDQVLQHVAAVIAGQARQADSVGRHGGDEFIIVAPQSTRAGAAQAAERLRKAMEDEDIHVRAHNLRITLSIGVAAQAESDSSVSDVIGRADRALYRAKARGRNNVESHP